MPVSRVKSMTEADIEKARSCLECGDCMTRCPYNLKIPELLKNTLAWWDKTIV
jgi:predicted aldo/keto reductase-like oxidoreductase